MTALSSTEDAFAAARGLFERVTGDLGGPRAAVMTHGELEDMLAERMREVTRQLFQDHLDLRTLREQRVPEVVDADGGERTRIERGRTRKISTVFGKVTTTRIAYRGDYIHDLHPADAALNLPEGMHTHGIAKLAAIEATRGSFAEACAQINQATGAGVGKRQVEQLAIEAAGDIDAFYDARIPEPATPATLLVLSVDGKGIVIRPDSLRPGTAKAAADKGAGTFTTRLASGEKSGRKRMATLGAVYDAEPAKRSAADIITLEHEAAFSGDAEKQPGPTARAKWLTGSVADSAAQVVKAVFDQAEARDPEHRRPWVALVDGAPHQIEVIEREAGSRNVEITLVVDFIHVLEYLWGAAWSVHENSDPAAEPWVAAHARALLEGRAQDTIDLLARQAEAAGITGPRRKGIDAAIGYLTAKAPYLRYNHALASGWPIATGIIEGACRHLIKDRLDITGARWGLAGAEAVLKLRALRSNADFDDYWRWHQRQDYARNHQARYRAGLNIAA